MTQGLGWLVLPLPSKAPYASNTMLPIKPAESYYYSHQTPGKTSNVVSARSPPGDYAEELTLPSTGEVCVLLHLVTLTFLQTSHAVCGQSVEI